MSNTGINLFSRYCRTQFGQPVGKIALTLGRVCPNRQQGGCTYCTPASFTPYYLDEGGSIAEQLARGRRFLSLRNFHRYFAYFQQETSTSGPREEMFSAFDEAITGPDCVGLIVSTRPDCLGEDIVDGLASLRRRYQDKMILVEVGVQSSHDETLRRINRNHTYQAFVDAAWRLKAAGLPLGAHLIVGLPGEGFDEMRTTVQRVSSLGVNAIKFHHLQVIRGTALHREYETSPFTTYLPREYLTILARLLAHVPASVVIHRLWSSSDPLLLVQPNWGGLKATQLHAMLSQIMELEGLSQGVLSGMGGEFC